MSNFFDWLVGAMLSCVVASDPRSADPVIAAQKKAARGTAGSLFAAAMLCGLSLYFEPDTDAAGGVLGLIGPAQGEIVLCLACAALVASVCGLYFIVRYVLVSRWPEHFVDFSE